MKKIIFILACFVLPFGFTSCGDNAKDAVSDLVSDITGKIKMKIGDKTQTFSVAPAYVKDNKTYIASTTGSQHFALTLDGTKKGDYVLGFMSDLNIQTILSGSFSTSKMSSTLTYIPGNTSDTYEIVAGTCTITKFSSTQIKGTFSGWAVRVADLEGGLNLSILQNAAKITGSFTAPLTNGFMAK